MQNELIIVSEYCRKCHIEPSFIDLLQEGGLIEVMTEGGERYLTFTQLPDVERYSRMYYDLSINIEGIDAIHHLLQRMEEMRRMLSEDFNRHFNESYCLEHAPEQTPGTPEIGRAHV